MNILIVDDEPMEIDLISKSIDQKQYAIDQVLTATNALLAKKIIATQSVDILLCDIEMPKENGLDLLKWVRQTGRDIQCIFITCHADFSFAQQAMQLGCLDYLLKPVEQAGLDQCLSAAVDRIKRKEDQKKKNIICSLWSRYQPLVVEGFWREILNHKTPSDYASICQAAADFNLEGLEETEILPVLIHARRWLSDLSARDVKIMEFGLKNIAEELLILNESNGLIIDLDHGMFVGLIYLDPDDSLDLQSLREACQKLIEACLQYLACEVTCYIGSPVLSHRLAQMTDELIHLDHENLAGFNRVMTCQDAIGNAGKIGMPNISDWILMLSGRDIEALRSKTHQYFKILADSNAAVSSQDILEIQHHFMQEISRFLHQRGIDVQTVFNQEQSAMLFRNANRSVWDMEQWILHNFDMITAAIESQNSKQTSVEKAKSFIEQNISQTLTCEDIAAHVYLNPIYLNRIFKQEIGMPLMEYLLNKRLDLAKRLLDETNMTVSSIALAVGYSNFSYFSRLFRKCIGVSPMGYRKLQQN